MRNPIPAGVAHAVLLLLPLFACGDSGSESDSAAGAAASAVDHERMRDTLSKWNQRTRAKNRFLGDGELLFLRARLDAAEDDAPAIDRGRALVEIGRHELRLGLTEEALASLHAAEELLERMPADARAEAEIAVWKQLGVAYLRLGENENCVHCTNGQGCIFPIQAAGVHTQRRGSEAAEGVTARCSPGIGGF